MNEQPKPGYSGRRKSAADSTSPRAKHRGQVTYLCGRRGAVRVEVEDENSPTGCQTFLIEPGKGGARTPVDEGRVDGIGVEEGNGITSAVPSPVKPAKPNRGRSPLSTADIGRRKCEVPPHELRKRRTKRPRPARISADTDPDPAATPGAF